MGTSCTPVQGAKFLQLLADQVRWDIVSALARSDHRVQELVDRCGKPINLVSYHLAKLRGARLVHERRSDADSRDVYYSLDLDRLRELFIDTGDAIHPTMTNRDEPRVHGLEERPSSRIRVLFVCTENSARSQMAEGILRKYAQGKVQVVSAGSRPTSVHPLAIHVLAEHEIDISHHRSKSLDEFSGEHFDYVITVCDRAREECPSFQGNPERIHWSFADPARVEGDENQRYLAFKVAAKELMTMIRYLLMMIERKLREVA